MDYLKHYNLLIEKSRNRIIDGYTETHHIIPRCMDGSDDRDNLTNLTAKEHFIAHLLLAKIYGGPLWHAVHMMSNLKKYKSRVYKQAREEHANRISQLLTNVPKSEEHKKKLSIAKENYIPWNTGIKLGSDYRTSGSWEKGNIPWNKGKEHMAGEKNPSFGKVWNKEKRDKMSGTNKGRKRIYKDDGSFYYIYPHLMNEVNV